MYSIKAIGERDTRKKAVWHWSDQHLQKEYIEFLQNVIRRIPVPGSWWNRWDLFTPNCRNKPDGFAIMKNDETGFTGRIISNKVTG